MRLLRKKIRIGNQFIGGGMPVLVQSMLSVPANDIKGNVEQAIALQNAGCDVVRVAVPAMENVPLIKELKQVLDIPLVADIHFDYRIARACIDAGVDKIRLNPGNIGNDENVKIVANACQEKDIPIRIGVNGGSLEKDILKKYGKPSADALCESAMRHVKLLEKYQFYNIVISIKSSDVPVMIAAYKKIATLCEYPLHLGVTEAGIYQVGITKSAMGIGSLLIDGIGDTIRVALTGDPLPEVSVGFDILQAAGYEVQRPEIISCPTCGRTKIAVEKIAKRVSEELATYPKRVKVAVMGCVVNGPGEAREADIGIAGIDEKSAVLFVKGEKVRTLTGDYVDEFIKEVKKI